MRSSITGAGAAALTMLAVATGAATAQEPSPSPNPPYADHELMHDTFDAPGFWWTGDDDVVTSSIADGAMRWTIFQDRQSIWDATDLPAPLRGVLVGALVLVDGGIGAAGPLCAGADDSERAIWAGVNGVDTWFVGRIVDSRMQVVERGDLPAEVVDELRGFPGLLLVELECTIDSLGADRYRVWVEGVQVADGTDEPLGPFQRTGLIGSAEEAGFSVQFDGFTVHGGPDAPAPPDSSAPAAPSPSSLPAT